MVQCLRGIEVQEEQSEKAGNTGRMEEKIEVGEGEVIKREETFPQGWEWIWRRDPWTERWARLRVPRRKADRRKIAAVPNQPSYWGEAEVREWQRRIREEREKLEEERHRRIEW